MMWRNKPLTGARLLATVWVFWGLLLAAVALGTVVGVGHVEWSTLWSAGDAWSPAQRAIVFDIRLPRVLLAGILGGSLTVAGVVFQALLRNPLADPYVLGVSGGASLGGVLALMLGLGGATALGGSFSALMVPLMAFVGAMGALWLIRAFASVNGYLNVYTVLLTGVIFNAFSGAFIYFVQSIASLQQLHAIVFYLMGSVPSLSYAGLLLMLCVVLAAVGLLSASARDYNVMTLGEEGAAQLGVDVERLKTRSFVLGSLLTGLAVSVAGLIGFVGLVVPHLLRLVFGADHRLLLPLGFLGGAALLIVADTLARLVIMPAEVPVGVITALLGGPFFLVLLRRRGKEHTFG